MQAADPLLASVDRIAADAAARASEIEDARAVPDDLIARLREAGFYRLLVPHALGGSEADLSYTLKLLEVLARGDASTAWVAMHGHHAAVLPMRIRKSAFDAIYAAGPDVVWANSMTAAGRAERVAGGYRVSGRWAWSSGCRHADWIFGLCVETEGGEPVAPAVPGMAPILGVVAPASAWTIEDTWRASGLKGTGSHHIGLHDMFIEEAWTFQLYGGQPAYPGPMSRYGPALLSLQPAAITLGIARGALDDVAALARGGKGYTFARQPLKHSEIFHYEIGRVEAEFRAAAALLQVQCDVLWRRAQDGALDNGDIVEAAQARTWIGAASAHVVDACYTLAGSVAVMDACALQRRLRDVRAISQHATLNLRQYAFAGEVLSGHPPRNPLAFTA